ncbi:SusC/RagA family TonB-linked outer membrane protein [Ferruginibacter sp.]
MQFIITIVLMCAIQFSFAQKPGLPDSPKTSSPLVLDSVVVFSNGYQVISGNRATGSYTQVDNKTLNLQVSPNILARLESVTNAVAVFRKGGSMPAITVRGLSTINGPTAPLIILDNFPFEGDINSINPNLVESITILKDATAAAIWGTRAGNGVIVINTKKGRYGQPLSIDLSVGTQVVDRPNLHALHTISSSDYIDVEQLLYSKGYYNSQLSSSQHPTVSPVVDLLDKQARGLVSATEASNQIAAWHNTDVQSQLEDSYYQKAFNQQYALTFSGGSNRSAWLAALGYDRNNSSLSESYSRRTVKLETSFNPVNRLRLTVGSVYTNSYTHTGKDDYGAQDYLYPYSSIFNTDGTPAAFDREYRKSYTDTLWAGKLLDWNYYAADNYRHQYTTVATDHLLIDLAAQYRFNKGFSFEYKYRSEQERAETQSLGDEQSYLARYNVNLFSQVNAATGIVNYIVPKGGILDDTHAATVVNNYRAQLNYNHSWGRHHVTALAGNELRQIHTTSSANRTFGYYKDLALGAAADMRNQYPLITTGAMAYLPAGPVNFSDQLKRYVSFYANANWNFDDKYNFSLSGRRDASNLFGALTNDKWTPLWSAGAGWEISKEHFWHNKQLSLLRLRASYGYTGNADPSRSAVVTVFLFNNSAATGFPGYRILQFPTPHLRWEKTGISNIGLDFGLSSGRINGSLEYYSKRSKDLFAYAQVDPTAGIGNTGIVQNIGSMTGKGIDLTINSRNITGKFAWSTNLLFNYNTDRISESYLNGGLVISYVNDGTALTSIQNKPVHEVISLRWAGLDHTSGNPQGYLNGALSTDYPALTGSGLTVNDLEYSGPAMPQIFGSVTNEFSYKKFSLLVNISYKLGYYFKRKPLYYLALFSNDRRSTSDFAARWQQPGDELITDVPSLVYPVPSNRDNFYTSSAAIVEKGDHIRLQFVNLSYKFSLKTGLQKNNYYNMQCFLNAANLGILWRANKHGLDPDYPANVIPSAAAIALGLKIFIQ